MKARLIGRVYIIFLNDYKHFLKVRKLGVNAILTTTN